MENLKNKKFWDAACARALRTFCQTAASLIPAGFVVTAQMVENVQWSHVLYAVAAVIATSALAGIFSLLNSIATGLPEVDE